MEKEKFSSRLGFILISAGCAIGLGNVYKFPIWTGAYGGAIFVLIYLIFLVILGIPVMTEELAVGRASQKSIATSFDTLEKPGQKWHLMKYLGVVGNYLLMMFYTCIAGWFVTYFVKYVDGSILQFQSSDELFGVFIDMITTPASNIIYTAVVVVLCFAVCSLGLQKGVERITKVMMILLFVLLVGLAIYCLTMSGAGEGLKFYFVPSLERAQEVGWTKVISSAMSQAFFTLSLGIGSIGIFGASIGKERSLLGESCTIVALDTFVAITSGLILFPAYFTFNPGSTITGDQAGATFLFATLSTIFNHMAVGRVLGALFFLFMIFASFSTVIAVFENIVAFWLEHTKVSRKAVCLINIVFLMVATLPFIFCNAGVAFTKFTAFGRNFADFEDFLVSNFALPFGCLIYTLFCTSKFGWGWDKYFEEVNAGEGAKLPKWMKPYMTYVLPLIIFVVLIMSLTA